MQDRLAALKRLQEIVDVLRGPQGCPWDRAQKLENMGRYLLEEASEAVDAIEEAEGRPSPEVKEELGDLLMNIFLASKIAADEGAFDLADVAADISEKLIRRHPHVFEDGSAGQPAPEAGGVQAVVNRWNAIKEAEKLASHGRRLDRPGSRLDRVPRSLPSLLRSLALGKEAARAGFDWPEPGGALAKVAEELEEVRAELEGLDGPAGAAPGGRAALEEELGDLLFAVSNLCRKLDVCPEAALRRTLRKFCERFRRMEERVPEMEKASLEDLESAWQQAKAPLKRHA